MGTGRYNLCGKKIRNPQVVGFEHLYFLHGRSGNNGEQAGNFVLYCSEDGIHWDEGRYLKVRTEGLGAYSNNLVIGKGTSHEKLLIQASHAYKDNQTNVLHWQIIKERCKDNEMYNESETGYPGGTDQTI